jgi:hypothetical protein
LKTCPGSQMKQETEMGGKKREKEEKKKKEKKRGLV